MKSVNKETITEVALDLFLKEGFNNVTVNQICEHCDITKPTFYKYVNSKDDLILNLYDQTISNILGDTYHLLQADSHFEQLLMIFNALIQETKRFGSDLFSHMLIANLNENKHSFDMRNSLTDLCVMIIRSLRKRMKLKTIQIHTSYMRLLLIYLRDMKLYGVLKMERHSGTNLSIKD